MKKITVGLVLMTFLAFGASAQEKQHGGRGKHKANYHRQHITKDLNLTEDQKQKMKAIHEDHRKQMAELKKNENITVKEMRDRKSSLAQQHKSAIEGILTPEQKTKLQEQRNKSMEKAREMRAKRTEKMTKELALTEAQSSKLKSLNENYQSKFESVRKDESIDRPAKKEQFKALKQQRDEELKNVLTQEQMQKLAEMKKDKSQRRQAK
jgi:Spy/CpxP family protein refolding chaperone